MTSPDPFENPLEYWHMVKNCPVTSEYQKDKQLEAVNLDYEIEPKMEKTA